MTSFSPVRLVECPRDAMQGWKLFIPTEQKIAYINSLLEVGFDTIDCGSFVSAKAIPQMADTAEVIRNLDLSGSKSKLLTIVANRRGAEEAVLTEKVSYLGFPFSVSQTFQLRNTNATIEDSVKRVEEIQELCVNSGKELVVYISMGFGNPYGDPYSEEIGIISLADTVGLASPEQVYRMTEYLVDALPGTQIGVHLHARHDNWQEKLEAAVKAGCTRFDGALKGIGGCPMAGDELVGNMDMERMIAYFGNQVQLNQDALRRSLQMASSIFSN
jgi:hydroxymethylglutaryl-CoA lyase